MRNEIRTDLNIPNPDKPGYLMLDRILTNKEVEEQIIKVLGNITIDYDGEEMTAKNAAENVFYDKYTYPLENEFPFHNGEILVAPTKGRCEGQIIKILVLNKDNNYECFCTIKYFIGMKAISQIALELHDAFENGYYN